MTADRGPAASSATGDAGFLFILAGSALLRLSLAVIVAILATAAAASLLRGETGAPDAPVRAS